MQPQPRPTSFCPDCGATLPLNAPHGLCPRCLIGQGIEPTPSDDDEGDNGGGVMATLIASVGPIPRVLLRDTDPETGPGPMVRPSSSEMPATTGRHGRYQLLGEIARGGMGAVLKGRDTDLGRDLAIKVLLETHRARPRMVRRFVEEAQIGGQLQHPGIVPVYELGAFDDARPYFAMKLVKGRTLASLLSERDGPADGLPRFLTIFEQVCQTVAYAHARGVIHRDLKPSNIMVGGFGEVQVMDWGLAKVLARDAEGGPDDLAALDTEPAVSTIRTSGSGPEADASQAGSVLGTPSYMAPEQARGEVDSIDERADVFGLGSILCEILTGRPAITGRSAIEIQRKAAAGDLAEASDRLEECRADSELVDLARWCLSPDPSNRLRNAGEVARRLTAYLAGVQERLRAAELARAAEEAKTVEARATAAQERRARRLTAALAASTLLAAALGTLGWRWVEKERLDRARATSERVNIALLEATRGRGKAQAAAVGDLAPWAEAFAAIRKARDLIEPGVEPQLRRDVEALLAEITTERAKAEDAARAAETDRLLLDRLVDVRSARADDIDGSATEAGYAGAFREAGLDLSTPTPREAGERIAARPGPSAVSLAAGLDDWAAVRRARRDLDGAKRLTETASAADPDPWRGRLRETLNEPNTRSRRDALRLLADSAPVDTLPAVSLDLLGQALKDVGDPARAESVLRRAQWKHPGDVWLNYDLAVCLEKQAKREAAIRYYTAARAIRTESAHELAHALQEIGEADEAITVFQELASLRPKSARHHLCLGRGLIARGRATEGRAVLDKTIALCRESIAARPDEPRMHRLLGNAFSGLERYDEAIAAYRTSLRLKPDDADTHYTLGNLLDVQNKLDEAIPEFQETLRLRPDDAEAHGSLGGAYFARGKIDDAIREYREALRLRPDNPEVHCNLGQLLQGQGRFDQAIVELQRGHELGSKRAGWPYPSAEWVKKARRLAGLDARLPALLRGSDRPSDADELLLCGELCSIKKLYGPSAQFRLDAFRARPALADDPDAGNRYNAACIAALAGCGLGADVPPLDEKERARWRGQALDWLRADLAARIKILESDDPEARARLARTLAGWKEDRDLAGLRDPAALEKLTDDEKTAWRDFWSEVERARARAIGDAPR